MAQTLFSRIVSIKLPLAVPAQLSHIDDFELGQVFISSKKPPRFRPQKNEDLKYTGVSLASLLEESSMKDFEIMSSVSIEFVTSKDDPLNLNFDLSSKSPLKKALTKLQFPVKDVKHATLTADLGKVKCLEANLLYSCSTKNLRVKLDNPTIKEAMATSSSLFVITHIYRGDRCHLNVSLEETQKEIVSRDKKTVIAYLLMKFSFDSSGVLTPMLNTGRLNVLERRSPKKSTPSSESDAANEGDKIGIDPAAYMKDQVEAEESLNIPGWIMVDVISTKENIPEEGPEENVRQQSEATGVLSGAQPVVEEAVVSKVTNLTSVPNPAGDMLPQDISQKPGVNEPELNQRYIYSLKDFQPFESMTYNGIYTEVQQWIKPVMSNKILHSVFLEYTVPPRTVEKLNDLSQYLLVYGKALRDHKTTPFNSNASIEPVLSALTVEWAAQLDEVSSLIIVCEALREFPQHIVKKARQLPAEKVSILVDLVRSTPYGGDKHVYMDEGPLRDPDLNPFMTRMGFSAPPPSNKLVLDLSHEENEDRLAAGMILLLASQPQ